MGSLTPKPANQQKNKKFNSKVEKWKVETTKKDEVPTRKKRYKKLKIKNSAPNWVQKNMRYAASTHRRVLAKLYKMKNEGTKSISYAKKKE